MSIYTHLTRRVAVRWEFADCQTYRSALGDAEPLLALATDGPIDAPEYLPGGGYWSSNYGPTPQFASR